MDAIAAKHDAHHRARLLHEAGYAVAARELGVTIRTDPRRGLRCFEGDVFSDADDPSADDLERRAVVVLAGHFALAREGADGVDRDALLAGDIILGSLLLRYDPPLSPTFVSGYVRARMTELSAQAARLVEQNWPAIQAETTSHRAAPRRKAS